MTPWLLNSVPVLLSRRWLLTCELPLNKETSIILHSGLWWNSFIITYDREEPGCRGWCRGHRWRPLICSPLLTCSACVVVEPRTTGPGTAPPTVNWALPNQSLNKKMHPTQTCPQASLVRTFSQLRFCLPKWQTPAYVTNPLKAKTRKVL